MTVHNHGPAEGPGLGCPERRTEIGGYLRGACLPDPEALEPYCDHGPLDACRCLAPEIPALRPSSVYMRGKVAQALASIAGTAGTAEDLPIEWAVPDPVARVETLVVGPPEPAQDFGPNRYAHLAGIQVRAHLEPGDQIAAIVKDHDGKVLGFVARSEVERIQNLPSAEEARAYAVRFQSMLEDPVVPLHPYATAERTEVPDEWRAWCPTCSDGFGPVVPMLARNWATIHNESAHGGRGNGGRPW